MSKYNLEPCEVTDVKGSEIKVITKNGTTLQRNRSFFKKIPQSSKGEAEEEEDDMP